MCGIAGKISFTSQIVSEPQLRKMTDAICHRGPDDEGVFISPDKKVGLGHRRLAIIDLSPKGHQPMEYLDNYYIVFNGEIYNFKELKKRFVKMGYKFKSNSDTEVILALYDKYGTNCLQYLRGMFAFAIYDKKKKVLFCARDRLGKKPFKYYLDSKCFIFASELKAIITQPEVNKIPDFTAIHHFLTLQYVPSPFTGFENIYKLEPAHYLLLDITRGKIIKKRYWDIDFSHKEKYSESEWCERILSKLEESVKIRMISDVPIGAFLSGGIDSSTVVALMAKNSSQPVKTFSIGFEEKMFNELPYAMDVAKMYSTDHTEFIVKASDMENLLPKLVEFYEEPYADSSALPTYLVSKLTRQHVTVALNGDGGDENFAGYPWYPIQYASMNLEKIRWVNNLMGKTLTKVLYNNYPSTLTDRMHRFSDHLSEDYRYRYLNYICYFDNQTKKDLYSGKSDYLKYPDTFRLIADSFNRAKTSDILDQTLYTDLTTYLPDDLLVKVDIASMANSLETRSPFLDQEFIELCSKIPSGLKLRHGFKSKYILKKAVKSLLPTQILTHKKQGFMIPKNKWYKDMSISALSLKLLAKNSFTTRYFNQNIINNIIYTHIQTNHDQSNKLWLLDTLNHWYKKYFS